MNDLPSTGDKTTFDTGAQRDSMSGKGLPSHLPTNALRRAAKRFEDGAKKYSDHNWRKGIPLSRYIDALYRHIWAYQDGDTAEDHLGAIIWNSLCLSETHDMIQSGVLPADMDDLWRPAKAHDREPVRFGPKPPYLPTDLPCHSTAKTLITEEQRLELREKCPDYFWLQQDQNGRAFIHKEKPYCCPDGGFYGHTPGMFPMPAFFGYADRAGVDWKDSLIDLRVPIETECKCEPLFTCDIQIPTENLPIAQQFLTAISSKTLTPSHLAALSKVLDHINKNP